jgi:hypothetical protein
MNMIRDMKSKITTQKMVSMGSHSSISTSAIGNIVSFTLKERKVTHEGFKAGSAYHLLYFRKILKAVLSYLIESCVKELYNQNLYNVES